MTNRVTALLATFCCVFLLQAEEEGLQQPKKTIMPKVPSRSAIVKPNESEAKSIGQWANAFIAAKEKKAEAELEVFKKTVLEEERTRQAEERNRLRRHERNDLLKTSANPTVKKGGPIRIQLDFQVPEIAIYRLAVELCLTEQKLANDVVEALSRMDKDNDGKLTNEEYKNAGALIITTRNVGQKLDSDADGMISEEELEAVRRLPENSAAAIDTGRESASTLTFKIKSFDSDNNGVLDVDERKRMVMSYVDAALRSEQEAQFYRSVADSLAGARASVAEKFADVLVAP
jgi:hypothetical protein